MFPGKTKYKVLVEYLATDDAGRHKAKRTLETTVPFDQWTYKEYATMEEFLKKFHKGRTDVTIISASEVK